MPSGYLFFGVTVPGSLYVLPVLLRTPEHTIWVTRLLGNCWCCEPAGFKSASASRHPTPFGACLHPTVCKIILEKEPQMPLFYMLLGSRYQTCSKLCQAWTGCSALEANVNPADRADGTSHTAYLGHTSESSKAPSVVLRQFNRFQCRRDWGQKDNIHRRISHSGSKGQYKGDTRNYVLKDPHVHVVFRGPKTSSISLVSVEASTAGAACTRQLPRLSFQWVGKSRA